MMKKIAAITVLVFATACTGDAGNKETVGTVLGGVGGAVIGSQFGSGSGQLAATAAGTLLGAFVGNSVGSSLDKADMMYANRAQSSAQAAPIGQTISWSNPQSGNSGTIVPTREGRDNNTGAYCREFQNSVTVGGKTQSAYGTACQQPDGSWKVVQ